MGPAPDVVATIRVDDARLARGLRRLHDAARPAPSDRRRPLRADAARTPIRAAPTGPRPTTTAPTRAASASTARRRAATPSTSTARRCASSGTIPRPRPSSCCSGSIALPWDYRMTSGRTLWEELVRHYDRGAEGPRALEARWTALAGPGRRRAASGRAGKLQRQADGRRRLARQVPALLPGVQRGPPTAGRFRGGVDAPPAYLDPASPFEARAADLVSRMTVEEKVSQLTERGAGHPAARRPGLRLVERVPARRGPRRRGDGVPAGHRHGRLVRPGADARGRDGHQRRGARQAPRVRAARAARPLPGPDLLVAEHQHLPRPALGPRPGDLRRGPVPHRAHGRRVREGRCRATTRAT